MPSKDIYENSEKHKRVVQKMARMPHNKVCADCSGKGPSWASWNLGVFICIKCAGIHRKLGTHISQVRSTTLDKWTLHQVQNMQKIGGNSNANYYYEFNKPDRVKKPKENDDSFTKEQYIRQKYEKKRWVNKKGTLGEEPTDAVDKEKVEKVVQKKEPAPASKGSPRRTTQNSNGRSASNPMRRRHARRTPSASQQDNGQSLIDFGEDKNASSSNDNSLDMLMSSNNNTTQQQSAQPVRSNPRPQQQQPQQMQQQQQQPQQRMQGQDLLVNEQQQRNKSKASIMGLFDQPAPQHNQPNPQQQRRFMPPMPNGMPQNMRQGMPNGRTMPNQFNRQMPPHVMNNVQRMPGNGNMHPNQFGPTRGVPNGQFQQPMGFPQQRMQQPNGFSQRR